MNGILAGFATFALLGACAGQSADVRKALPAEHGETKGAFAQEILEVKRQYDEAQMKNDGAWFERMFADDYIFVLLTAR
jgi:hypothetical protein